MRYFLRTESEDQHELYSPNELEWAVARLNDEPGSFLCVEPEYPIEAVTYMQASYVWKKEGFFKKKIVAGYFQVEAQEKKPNGDLFQYIFITDNPEEVQLLFSAFFEFQRVPELTKWKRELFYKA